MTGREHRGTIFVDDAEVRAHQEFPGRQYVIRLHAPALRRGGRTGQLRSSLL
jgi:hypothetical protein